MMHHKKHVVVLTTPMLKKVGAKVLMAWSMTLWNAPWLCDEAQGIGRTKAMAGAELEI